MRLPRKIFAGLLIIIAFFVAVIIVLAVPNPFAEPESFGVSFSAQHTEGVGLDWKEVYDATLDDLGVRNLRLSAYWNEIEPADDQFDFSILDYQMKRAEDAGAKVVLGVGRKLPRWPECHEPAWADALPEEEIQQKVLEMIPVVVERYQNSPALVMWQLENEPFLDFGDCPLADEEFFAEEEALLRSLDPSHPILVTDSGELNWWLKAGSFGDQVGTTMYRTVYSKRTKKEFHYDYLFPSWLYRAKSRLVGLLRGKSVLISELQGEPWTEVPWNEATVAQRRQVFSVERFGELHDFAARTQLTPAYWWGVEYWYWEKEVNGEPIFWQTAKNFF